MGFEFSSNYIIYIYIYISVKPSQCLKTVGVDYLHIEYMRNFI